MNKNRSNNRHVTLCVGEFVVVVITDSRIEHVRTRHSRILFKQYNLFSN